MEREIDYLARELAKIKLNQITPLYFTLKAKNIGTKITNLPRLTRLLQKYHLLDISAEGYFLHEEKIDKFFEIYNKKYPIRENPVIHSSTFDFISNTIFSNLSKEKIDIFLYDCNCDSELIQNTSNRKSLSDLIRYLSFSDNIHDQKTLKKIIEEIVRPTFNSKYKYIIKNLNKLLSQTNHMITYDNTSGQNIFVKCPNKIIWGENSIVFNGHTYKPTKIAIKRIIGYVYTKIANRTGKINTSFTIRQLNNHYSDNFLVNKKNIENFSRHIRDLKFPINISNKDTILIKES